MELAVLVSCALPAILWFVFWLMLPNCAYEMDPGGNRGMFLGIVPLYHHFFYKVCIADFVSLFVCAYFYSPVALFPLFMSMIYGALFIGFTVFFYEGYLAKPTSYTVAKYAAVMSLGFSSFALFVVGEACMLLKLLEYSKQ